MLSVTDESRGRRGDLGELTHYVAPNSTKVHSAKNTSALFGRGVIFCARR